MEDAKFSFIIASCDRKDDLRRCLASIEKAHEYAREVLIEIIIVFNGQESENIVIETKYPGLSFFYNIKELGLSKARNYGIKKSKGEYLIFLDDDAAIKEDFITILSKRINKNEADAFCGKILGLDGNSYFSDIYKHDRVKCLGWFDQEFFKGSAHILKKSLMEQINYYDERFGVGTKYCGTEDADVFFKLKQANRKILYVPELVYYHPIIEQFSPKKAFNYSYANGAVLIKQIIDDRIHFYIYSRILIAGLFSRIVGVLRNVLFPKVMANKNNKWQYNSALKGMIKGVIDYIKFR